VAEGDGVSEGLSDGRPGLSATNSAAAKASEGVVPAAVSDAGRREEKPMATAVPTTATPRALPNSRAALLSPDPTHRPLLRLPVPRRRRVDDRPQAAHLAGFTVKPGLPGLVGDAVDRLCAEGAAWLCRLRPSRRASVTRPAPDQLGELGLRRGEALENQWNGAAVRHYRSVGPSRLGKDVPLYTL
jgi:hypothetical protein